MFKHLNTQGVRQKHFQNVRQKIQDNLFLVKPTFSSHLCEIWNSANELRSISFASSNPSHLYGLQEWADLQVGLAVTGEPAGRIDCDLQVGLAVTCR